MTTGPSLLLFEDPILVENYSPLLLTRPIWSVQFGTRTLLNFIEDKLDMPVSGLFVREYLARKCEEQFLGGMVNPNTSELDETIVFLNAFVDPIKIVEVKKALRTRDEVAIISRGNVVAVRLRRNNANSLVRGFFSSGSIPKSARVLMWDKEDILLRYPWTLVPATVPILRSYSAMKGLTSYSGKVIGSKGQVLVSPSAIIEDNVTLDTSYGPIFVEDEAQIQSFSRVEGPGVIGSRTIVKSARISSSAIGSDCRVGGEVEHSIICSYTNKSHYGFIGHSYVGSWVNLGALTTNSDLKNTYGNIKTTVNDVAVDTGQMKLGCFISDNAKTAIGSLLFAGKKVGVASQVFGVMTRDLPSFVIDFHSLTGKSFEMDPESAIRTQSRMMQRRSVQQTEADRSILRHVFELTSEERTRAKVLKEKAEM